MKTALLIALLLLPCTVVAQRSRPAGKKGQPSKIPDLVMPAVTMRGTLRQVNKKEIVMDSGDDQIVTFRRVKKTRFLEGSKSAPESAFKAGAAIAVEATREPDGEFDALNVYLGEPPGSAASAR
jgi:hypothetical protein